jgi:hypothetical protein
MKIFLAVLFNVALLPGVLAQGKISQFAYTNSHGIEFANSTISDNCFLVEAIVTSLVKPPNSNKIYEFIAAGNKGAAIESSVGNYLGSDMMKITSDLLHGCKILKTDTTYYNADSLINGFVCKKVGMKYSFVTNPTSNDIQTIITNSWVNEAFKQYTPFSFVSNKVNGLIMHFERVYLPGGDYFSINSTTVDDPAIGYSIFQVPKVCKICTSQNDYEEIMGPLLMQKIGVMKQ